jgi:hypothetical protein
MTSETSSGVRGWDVRGIGSFMGPARGTHAVDRDDESRRAEPKNCSRRLP